MRKREVIFLGLVLIVVAAVTTFAVPLEGDATFGSAPDCGTVASPDDDADCTNVVNRVRLAAGVIAGGGLLVIAFGWMVLGDRPHGPGTGESSE